MLCRICEAFGDDVIGSDLRCSGSRGSSSVFSSTPSGVATNDSRAMASPCPLTTAGCRPRATSRSSSSDWATSPRARFSLVRVTGSVFACSASRPSSRARATRRCCAPSWRLRSRRRRSFWCASIHALQEPCSSCNRARSSASSRPFSKAMAAAAPHGQQLRFLAERGVVDQCCRSARRSA